jgi:hypothetical protein
MAGAHLRERSRPWRRNLQTVGSWLILAAPGIFTAAFFLEPAPQNLWRPFALSGLIMALAGTVLHMVASYERDVA